MVAPRHERENWQRKEGREEGREGEKTSSNKARFLVV